MRGLITVPTMHPWISSLAIRLQPLQGPLVIAAVIAVFLIALTGLHPLHALAIWLAIGVGGLFRRAPDLPSSYPIATRPKEPSAALLLDEVPDPVVLVDHALHVRFCNKAAKLVLPHLVLGEPLLVALRVPEVVDALRTVIEGGEARRVGYRERVPVQRVYEAQISALADIDPRFVLIVLRDVTEAKRLDAMRADFVANASHELRTPLASLVGFIDTLQGSARDDPAARERFLVIMREQAGRMSRLIDDLLSLSRIEMNQHRRPDNVVDLVEIVSHVADALRPLAAERGVDVVVALKVHNALVAGDRDELIRAFENLIENAIKYGGSGGQVDVEMVVRNSEATVQVSDKGPGIAAEHLPRLTERFYRVDIGQSREKGGTGLGLAIVKHIVARHRGVLTIESKLGEGSTFAVNMAVLPDAQE